jgi:RNA polymerase sigma factor (TIGR02999 family)
LRDLYCRIACHRTYRRCFQGRKGAHNRRRKAKRLIGQKKLCLGGNALIHRKIEALKFRPVATETVWKCPARTELSLEIGGKAAATRRLTALGPANMLLFPPGAAEGPMPPDQPDRFIELLQQWKQGDEEALGTLLPLVYKELRRLAHYHLQSERQDHTLQSTALVHEAYIRLLGNSSVNLQNRGHFIAVASRLMRQILVDYARERGAAKRDGGCRIALEYLDALPLAGDAELLALDDALKELSRIDERQAKIVEMKFFGGLSAPEISEVLGLSRATVDRDWATARVWLHRQIKKTA